jgi:oligoendopeptidase F
MAPSLSPVAPSQRWSLQSYFTAFGAPEYVEFKEALRSDLAALRQKMDSAQFISPCELNQIESLASRFLHLSSYLACLSAEDAASDAVRAEEAGLATLEADLTKIQSCTALLLAALEDSQATALYLDPSLGDATHALQQLRRKGLQLMPAAQEALAADLGVDGVLAWGRLYDTLAGRLSFDMEYPDGRVEPTPMARRRALMSEPDRQVRAAAFSKGQAPWNAHADTFAAALNAIAGTRLSLYSRRRLADFLAEPLADSGMSRATLDALVSALHSERELSRRTLRTAARLQGAPLHFHDLEAPQIAAPPTLSVSWAEACNMVGRAFHSAYPALGHYFDRILESGWIEAEPRSGKRPGAFCTDSPILREQRVFMTHGDTMQDVVTLAHEVGHAWHAHLLRERRLFAAQYPMTLAETASNFGEMLLLEGVSRDPGCDPALAAYLLDQQANRMHAYLLNIPMRYAFEHRFYETRKSGEQSADQLRKMMSETQRDWYGDTLSEEGLDPMFWASKLHFYITGVSFYNFPYAFGFLLSQSLFARFLSEGPSFLPKYEAFLSQTGSGSCEKVALQALGSDITQPAFWVEAIRSLEPMVAAYERLAPSPEST